MRITMAHRTQPSLRMHEGQLFGCSARIFAALPLSGISGPQIFTPPMRRSRPGDMRSQQFLTKTHPDHDTET
jgi:hypothetical protein